MNQIFKGIDVFEYLEFKWWLCRFVFDFLIDMILIQ